PSVEQLTGGHRAEPQIFRHHVATARDGLDAVVSAEGQELDRDDGGERNPAEQRLVALGVVAEARELPLRRPPRFLREISLSDMWGVAWGADIAMVAPLRSCGPLTSARANPLCPPVCQ